MSTEELKGLVESLPISVKENAKNLLQAMESQIEGIGDDAKSWRPDFLKVVQGTTDMAGLPKGAGRGSIVLGEMVMEQPFGVIPLMLWKSRKYWSPDISEKRLFCQSPDAKTGQIGPCSGCKYAEFDTAQNKSLCNKDVSVLCIDEKFTNIFTIQFSKTGYKNGTDWESLMVKAKVPPFRKIYDLSTRTHPDYKAVEVLSVSPRSADKGSPHPEMIKFLEVLFRKFKADREELLTTFREATLKRIETRNHPLLAAAEEEQNNVTLIPASGNKVSVESTPKYSL